MVKGVAKQHLILSGYGHAHLQPDPAGLWISPDEISQY
jgi:hypothetical protein